MKPIITFFNDLPGGYECYFTEEEGYWVDKLGNQFLDFSKEKTVVEIIEAIKNLDESFFENVYQPLSILKEDLKQRDKRWQK